jgi:hypothetical protein
MSTGKSALFIGPLLLVMASTPVAKGTFLAFSETAVFDPATGLVSFTINFNQPPDFYTVDTFDRAAHSFQYYIIGDPALGYPEKYDSIIGNEIGIDHSLSIRNSVPSVPDPAAGGWGSLRGVAPFTLSNTLLNFSAPLGLVTDHSVDGHFSYELLLTEFGDQTQFMQGQTIVLPEPVTVGSMLVGVLALLAFRCISQKKPALNRRFRG